MTRNPVGVFKAKKTPGPNIQAPEKLQASISKRTLSAPGIFGELSLVVEVYLEVGTWGLELGRHVFFNMRLETGRVCLRIQEVVKIFQKTCCGRGIVW
jgi:hypothetical protein